jgi:hypothetical protein
MDKAQLAILKAQVGSHIETIENIFDKVEEREGAQTHQLSGKASLSGCTTCTALSRTCLSL